MPPYDARKSGYLPSLDGWRAIAILGVIFSHDQVWWVGRHSLQPLQEMGSYGVDLFFAISGILITTRILQDEKILGRFEIGKFYTRRLFRIQPAQWVYLAVLGVLMLWGVLPGHLFQWFGALLMYENFVLKKTAMLGGIDFVGHFWTLAVEEHFYILLSLFLLFVKRFRLAALVVIWLSLLAFYHYEAYRSGGELKWYTERLTWFQLPILVYGSLLAVALRRPNVRLWMVRYLKPWAVFCVSAGWVIARGIGQHLVSPSSVDFGLDWWRPFIVSLSEIFFALWVLATMLHAESLSTKILEWRPLRWLGRLSYSLYIWHVLFFAVRGSVKVPGLMFLSSCPVKYIASLTLACLSYYVIEKPAMRLGHRLAPPATPGHQDLAVANAAS